MTAPDKWISRQEIMDRAHCGRDTVARWAADPAFPEARKGFNGTLYDRLGVSAWIANHVPLQSARFIGMPPTSPADGRTHPLRNPDAVAFTLLLLGLVGVTIDQTTKLDRKTGYMEGSQPKPLKLSGRQVDEANRLYEAIIKLDDTQQRKYLLSLICRATPQAAAKRLGITQPAARLSELGWAVERVLVLCRVLKLSVLPELADRLTATHEDTSLPN